MKTETQPPLGEEVRDLMERIWLAGLGAFSMAEAEGGKLFQSLAEAGKRFETKVRGGAEELIDGGEDLYARLVGAGERFEQRIKEGIDGTLGGARKAVEGTKKRIEDGVEDVEGRVRDVVEEMLRRLGVPTRAEIEELNLGIDRLTEAVEKLRSPGASGAALRSIGGGWYEIVRDGVVVEKVQGRESAEAALRDMAE